MKKTVLSLFFAMIVIISTTPITVFAANVTYLTVKDNVQVWSSYSSNSSKKYVISKTGTPITVTNSKTNSSSNLWYQISDGNWVFSDNVVKHTSHNYSGGICKDCGYEWPYTTTSMTSANYTVTNTAGASIWSRPYSNKSTLKSTAKYGSTLTIVAKTTNQAGNLFYKTSGGTWVFADNLTKTCTHSYTGGICNDCGYEWPYTTTSMTSASYTVTNTAGASIWSRPYSNNSTLKSTAKYGSTLTIVAKTTNQAGNLWYKTSGGTWVFSDNVAKTCTHDYTGGICKDCGYEWPYTTTSMTSTNYTVTNTAGASIWSRPYSNNSTLKSTAKYGTTVTIVGQTTNQAGNLWYKTSGGTWVFSDNVAKTCSHNYTGGICNDCGYEWPYTTTSMASTNYTVTNTEGASIWSRPYSNNSTLKSTAKYGTTVTIVGQTTNQAGNLWYKTSGGTWVFSDNVGTKCTHSYSGGICKDCGYEWPYTTTSMTSATYTVSNTSGASIWSRPYSNNSTLKNLASYGTPMTIVAYTTNEAGNLWYKTSDDTWVFSDNVEKHTIHSYKSASGDICTICGYQYQPEYTRVNATYYAINDDVSVRYAPYADYGDVKSTLNAGDPVYISYVFENSLGNVWYKTLAGDYIFSDNLTLDGNYNFQSTPSTSGSGYVSVSKPTVFSTNQKNVKVYQSLDNMNHYSNSSHTLSAEGSLVTIVSSQVVWGNGGVNYGQTVNGTWIDMSYLTNNDIQPPVIGLYTVTTNNTPLREKPSESDTTKATLQKGEQVRIVDTFYNDKGNPWGETINGFMVYMGNLNYTHDSLAIKINGDVLELSDPAYISNGSTMIPLRDIAEALGAYVQWVQRESSVIIQRGLDTAIIKINGDKLYGDEIVPLTTTAVVIEGKTYVPLRAVSEIFGATVLWVNDTRTVEIVCEVPTDEDVLDRFLMYQFNPFLSYTTNYINENATLSNAVLYSLSNIGDHATSVIISGVKTIPGVSYLEKFLFGGTTNDFNDISDTILKNNLSDIVNQIVLADDDYYDFSSFGDTLNTVESYLKVVEKGSKFTLKNENVSEHFMETLDIIGDTVDVLSISAEVLEYFINTYDRHMKYLDLIEEIYQPEKNGNQDVFDELRAEYRKSFSTIVKSVYDQIGEFAIGKVIDKASLLKVAITFIEVSTDVFGVKDSSTSAINTSAAFTLSGGVVSNYSYLCTQMNTASKSFLPTTTTSQTQWNNMVVNFIAAKGATMYFYEQMRAGTSDTVLQLYLDVQMKVLDAIQINTSILTARKAPYYIDDMDLLSLSY